MSSVSPFSEVVGQDAAIHQLEAAVRRPVHAYLFVGPSSVGKHRARGFTRRSMNIFEFVLGAISEVEGFASQSRGEKSFFVGSFILVSQGVTSFVR